MGQARGRIFNSRPGKSQRRLCYLTRQQAEAAAVEVASAEGEAAEGEAGEDPDEGRTPPRRTSRKTTGKTKGRMDSTDLIRVSFHPRLD